MFERILNSLRESGWALVSLGGNWVAATHAGHRRGLIFGNFSELPQEFKPWIRQFADIAKWDVIVFCPEGLDSSNLKQHRFPNIQLWFWDTQKGNIFPFPPNNDPLIPQWIKQLVEGRPIITEDQASSEHPFLPYLTYLFLGINLAVFLIMVLYGLHLFPTQLTEATDQQVLIAFGAKVNTLIQAGEVWRLLTSNFIHIGIIHLAFNLYALWVLGPLSEKSFGHRRFFVIYILSGLGGSLASFIFTTALSAGASGAIFGLLGALLYYSYKRPSLWKSGLGMNLVVVILVNFAFGIFQPGIDNFAHLGGLLTGVLTCLFFNKKQVS